MNNFITLLMSNRVLTRIIIIIIGIFIIAIPIYNVNYKEYIEEQDFIDGLSRSRTTDGISCNDNLEYHKYVVEKFYEKRKNWRTSYLGSVLFKNIEPALFHHSSRENKTFVILIWRYYDWLKDHHLRRYGKSQNFDPLHGCSVKNCIFTGNNSVIYTADALLIHMQRGQYPHIKSNERNLNQRWVFWSDEAPIHTYSPTYNEPNLTSLLNVFNWTMTYRSDSDVPVPYGRTLPLRAPIITDVDDEIESLIPDWNIKETDVLVSILISNCMIKRRIDYIKELQKHIKVDVLGTCSNNEKNKKICPGRFKTDCKALSKYFFYLVFENSMCRQYLTEKVFFNAYAKGAIPVIMGPPLSDCEKLLPPNSFLHVDNYKSPEDLAKHIRRISKNYLILHSYHRWRNHFRIVNEHGYFGGRSYHYCRLCEALNYNDGEVSIYDEDMLRLFFDPSLMCV